MAACDCAIANTAATMTTSAHILMCPPDHYGIEYEINPWMDRRQGADRHLAMTQWQDLRRLLEQAGATIECLRAGGRHARPGVHGQRGDDLRQRGRSGPLPPSAAAGRGAARPAWLAEHGFELRTLASRTSISKGPATPCSAATRCWPAIAFARHRRAPADRRPVGLPRDLAGTGRSALLPSRHLLLPAGPRRGDLLSAGLRRLRPAGLARGGRRVDSGGRVRGLELRLQRGRRRPDRGHQRRLPRIAPRVGTARGSRPSPRRWASSSSRADRPSASPCGWTARKRPAGSMPLRPARQQRRSS